MKTRILNKGLVTHAAKACKGQKCCLHNPSKHHMRTWPVYIRTDKATLAERMCSHGIGHPDPDSLKWLDPTGRNMLGVHGCDGCCRDK